MEGNLIAAASVMANVRSSLPESKNCQKQGSSPTKMDSRYSRISWGILISKKHHLTKHTVFQRCASPDWKKFVGSAATVLAFYGDL